MSSRILKLATFALLFGACAPSAPSNSTSRSRPAPADVEMIRPPVLTEAARHVEAEGELTSVVVSEDQLVFGYIERPENLPAVGDVVMGSLGGGYLRRVIAVTEESPTSFRLTTEPALLTDYYQDISFRSRYSPSAANWDSGSREVGRSVAGLGSSRDLFEAFKAEINDQCSVTTGSALAFEATLSPDFEFEVDISGATLQSMTVAVSGNLSVTASVSLNAGAEVTCELDFPFDPDRAWLTLPSTIPGTPIPLVHNLGPELRDVKLVARVSAGTVEAGAELSASIRIGADYRAERAEGARWRSIREWNMQEQLTSQVDGRESLDITLEGTPAIRYEVRVAGAAGPYVAARVPVTLKVHGDLCEWNAKVFGGVSMAVGGAVRIDLGEWFGHKIEYTLDDFEHSEDIIAADENAPWREAMGTISSDPSCMNPCTMAADCSACLMVDGCGWCEGTGCQRTSEVMCAGANAVTDPAQCDADPCNEFGSSCATCNGRSGCGFCNGQCVSDSAECPSGRQGTISSCHDCSVHTTCSDCQRDAYCGFCRSTGQCRNSDVGTCADEAPSGQCG